MVLPLIALLSTLSRRRLILKAYLFEVKVPLDAARHPLTDTPFVS
jgi:hypothetical protein